MSGTGDVGWIGFAPEVKVVERMLLSDLPAEEQQPFLMRLQAAGHVEHTCGGEVVFPKTAYTSWTR